MSNEDTTYEKVIKMLAANYEQIEHSIVNQLLLNVSNHELTAGTYRETIWKSLFEMIIPKKYCIEQGVFIIDSYGHKSKEVDLVIFDEMYTPYIFNYGKIKFIPIEAVAAVVQCKSTNIDDVEAWGKTIEDLCTSMDSVARTATKMVDNNEAKEGPAMQTATRPIMILCAMASMGQLRKFDKHFDIILSIDEGKKKVLKYISREKDSLEAWYYSLNHALKGCKYEEEPMMKEQAKRKNRIKEIPEGQREHLLKELRIEQPNKKEENVILSLIFQLNQLLMIVNNPMLFPHRAYAKRFQEILKKDKKGAKDELQK